MPTAVIQTGGKQYIVEPNTLIRTEKIKGRKEGEEVVFDRVLLVANGDEEVAVGRPFLKGVEIRGTVEEAGQGRKVTTVKFKAKSHYKKKIGHKQPYMKIRIADF